MKKELKSTDIQALIEYVVKVPEDVKAGWEVAYWVENGDYSWP